MRIYIDSDGLTMKKIKFGISTTHIIMLSFLLAILIGSGLLSLPISSATGEPVAYVDALFTSTTATCVTGLVVAPTFSTWSIFGQIIILILIQIGGLGIITVMTGLSIVLHRRMGIKNRLLIQDAFNLNTLDGLGKFVRKVIKGTLIIEGIGALLYMIVFVPEFGPRGIWISVFNSVSAFCNAGMDIVGENSLYNYVHNPFVNIVTCTLIILGGIGYIVWWDVIRIMRDREFKKRSFFSRLTLHSKIAITSTLALIFGGALLIFIFEYDNPLTMKNFSLFDKIQASMFQSITTRTAGFATLPQENLSHPTAILTLLMMFIGGSPVGTAGGVKTVTITVVFAAAISAIKNREEVSIFNRSLQTSAVSKALSVVTASFAIAFTSTILLSCVTDASVIDIIYETISASATVGLSRNLTGLLNLYGKIIIICTMYLGRIGPITLAIAFNLKKGNPNIVKEPIEEINVG